MNAGEIMVLRSRSNGRMKEKKQRRPSKVGNHKNQKAGHSSSEIEAILQVLPDIFFVIDLDGSIVRWNRAGELITGLKAAEILEKSALDFFPRSEHHRILEAIQEALVQGTHRLETSMLHRDGSVFPCQIRGSVLRNDRGTPVGIAGIIRDLTREKEAEYNLRKQEERFRALIEQSMDAIGLYSAEGTILYESPASERILGFSPAELIGRNGFEMVHPDDRLEAGRLFSGLMENPQNVMTTTIRCLHKDGSYRLLEMTGRNMLENPSVGAIVGNYRDVTGLQSVEEKEREREKAENEMRESEAKFRLLAEQTNALIFTTDTRGRITYANEATSKTLGVAVSGLLGSFYLNFVHRDDRKRVHQGLLRQMAEQIPGTMAEVRFRGANGRSGWLNIVADPVIQDGIVGGMKALAIDVTDKKTWELTLKESETKFRNIFDHAPVGIYQSTIDGKFLTVNPQLMRMLGYDSVEEMKKLDLSTDVYFDSADRSKAIEEFLAKGATDDVELRWKKRSGSPIWVSLSTHAVRDEVGNIEYFEAFVRDITQRKNAQLELLRNEEYYRSLIENSIDVTMLVDRDGAISYVSGSMRNVLGYKSAELVRQSFLSIFHPDDRPLMDGAFRKLRALPHETARIEIRAKHCDGQWRFIEATGHNMLHNPAVQGIVINFHDVTDRLEAEGHLKDSEQKYRQLVEQATDGILIADPKGCFVLVNEKGRQMLGYSEKEIAGMPIHDTYVDEESEGAEKRLQEAEREGSVRFERKMKRKDGTVFLAEINIKRLPDGHYQAIVRDITERNRAEAALRDSEEKFRSLAEESPNMIFINKRGKVVYANRRCEEIMGYSKDEFYSEGFDFRTLVAPESREMVENNFRAHLEGKDIQPYEYALMTKGGNRLFGLHATRVISYDGEKAILGIITDVTITRKAEETQRKLLAAVEQSRDVVFMTDVKGLITFVNPAFEKAYGYSREEVLGKTPRILKSGLYSPEYYSKFWNTLLRHDNVREEMTNKTKDGRYITMEASVTPVLNSQGELLGFLAVQTDITERKKTEQKVYEQATLLDNATDGILVINPEGKITYWNKGAERLYGRHASDVLGDDLATAIGIAASEHFDAFRKTLDEGSWEGEIENVTGDQKSITVQSRWTLLRSDTERPRSILIVNSDITEKKVLQKQFYRSQRLDSLGTLAGGIAHDLNNVLAPILLSFEVLSKHIKEESGKRMLRTAQESAHRGKQIVSQVLTFARGIEGKKGAIQVRHLLDEITNIVRETFPKSIEVYIDVPKDLWPISADAGQMHQVLMNLVVNARDAMLQGGTLSLTAENAELDEYFCRTQLRAHPGRYVVISVKDSGVGIPSTILDRIFDPFFTTKEMGKGTGLGLSTVHTIINSHEGFVDVTSAVGKGSTFKIYVPSVQEESEKQKNEDASDATMAHGEWILVIDDERPIRDITEQVLVHRGYNVVTASDGVEAVALFAERSGRFDLVLTDLMMPMMDGVATIRALRRIRPEIKIVAMSGMLTDDSGMQAQDLSPEAFLTKPFTSETLVQAIAGVLKNN